MNLPIIHGIESQNVVLWNLPSELILSDSYTYLKLMNFNDF